METPIESDTTWMHGRTKKLEKLTCWKFSKCEHNKQAMTTHKMRQMMSDLSL